MAMAMSLPDPNVNVVPDPDPDQDQEVESLKRRLANLDDANARMRQEAVVMAAQQAGYRAQTLLYKKLAQARLATLKRYRVSVPVSLGVLRDNQQQDILCPAGTVLETDGKTIWVVTPTITTANLIDALMEDDRLTPL